MEKQEIKKEKEHIIVNNEKKYINFDNSIKKIRINNAFVNPSKELKIKFIEVWNDFINYLNQINEFKIIGFIENSKVEVVSEYGVILSFESETNAIIFNQNLEEIENTFFEKFKNKIKLVALSSDEWLKEKSEFIKNKNKKYEYQDEKNIIKEENMKIKSIAEDIFGEDIIEIK